MLLALIQPEQLNPQASGPLGSPLAALTGLLPRCPRCTRVTDSLSEADKTAVRGLQADVVGTVVAWKMHGADFQVY